MLKLNNSETGTLTNVLYMPKLLCNLLSVGAAAEQDMKVEFGQNKCCSKTPNGLTVATGTLVNRMYQLDLQPRQDAQVADSVNRLKLWHQL